MAEELEIGTGTRRDRYAALLPQIKALCTGEPDGMANLANCTAALAQTFGFLWVGFYIVKGKELVLGPFQGPIACTRIAYGKGVCGTAWQEAKTIVVPDVDVFPSHIACSSLSKSEIVVPVLHPDNKQVLAVLDVDSEHLGEFTEDDATALEDLCHFLSPWLVSLQSL